MSSCHEPEEPISCHGETKQNRDYLLLVSSLIISGAYLISIIPFAILESLSWLHVFSSSIHDLINTMFWGVAVGILFICLISRVPREFIISILGDKSGLNGIVRAAMAGVLLDLCSHGILMVGAKLYERGASIGQVVAFLIASPWNSFSFTLILWAMVGFKWMLTFLIISMIIAIITGMVFEQFEKRQTIPANPNRIEIPEGFRFMTEAVHAIRNTRFDMSLIKEMLVNGLRDSRMVLRWIFFGIIMAALIRTFVSPDHFQAFFGPTFVGLGLTLLVATIMEICSEGTLPVAADILTLADAPGNSLTFLMAGVSTDYTEIMVLKETTSSWKIALFLPLITLPQILITGLILNTF